MALWGVHELRRDGRQQHNERCVVAHGAIDRNAAICGAATLQIAQELFNDGGWWCNRCRAANARKFCNDAMQKILFFSSYLTLRLVPTTSKVFKAFFASSCVSTQERKKEREKICSSILGYITPPFGFALPCSSIPDSVGWQRCNNISSLQQ